MTISYTFVYAKDHNNLNSIKEALVQLHQGLDQCASTHITTYLAAVKTEAWNMTPIISTVCIELRWDNVHEET